MAPTPIHRHHPPPSSFASFRGCCCCLFLLFSFLVLLVLAAALVVVLAVKPKRPGFDLQQVDVSYVGVTPTPTPDAAAAVSLDIRILFAVANDNKVGINYRESKFTIMYGGIPLGRAAVPEFYQPAHSVHRIRIAIVVDRVTLSQALAANLVRDISLYDRVGLRVVGDIGANIRILGLNSPAVQVSVGCTIEISPTRRALVDKQCSFGGLTV